MLLKGIACLFRVLLLAKTTTAPLKNSSAYGLSPQELHKSSSGYRARLSTEAKALGDQMEPFL